MIKWEEEVALIKEQIGNGVTLEDIGAYYGVSRQRMYQIINQYNIETVNRKRHRLLKEFDDPRYYWINRLLCIRNIPRSDRLEILKEIEVPHVCPCLGIELDWGPKGSRNDNSPSITKLVPDKGNTKGNLFVVSWRANRIKNDSTYKEISAISKWIGDKLKA